MRAFQVRSAGVACQFTTMAEKTPGESGTTEKGPLYTWEILESSPFTPRASGGFSRNVMMVHYNFNPHLWRCVEEQ